MRRNLVQIRALPRACWGWRLTAVPGKCQGALFAPYRLAMLLWKGIALRLGFLLLRKWCGARAPPKQRGIADWLSDWESLGLDLTAGKGSGATLTNSWPSICLPIYLFTHPSTRSDISPLSGPRSIGRIAARPGCEYRNAYAVLEWIHIPNKNMN